MDMDAVSPNPLKRKHSSEDFEMSGATQPNGSTVSDDRAAPELRRVTPSFLHTDPRPDDFAHAGIRRGIALALDHVGFESADAVAVESFALATEECMTHGLSKARWQSSCSSAC